MLLIFLACASRHAVTEMEARLAALEAAQAADAERIAALEAQVEALRAGAVDDVSSGAGTAVGTGPACREVDGKLVLPAEGLEAEALSRAGRYVPHRGADGEVDGFRVSAVRRGSLLDTCGFKNGDVVQRVNGAPLTTADQALAAYAAAASSTVLRFELSRRGSPAVVELHR